MIVTLCIMGYICYIGEGNCLCRDYINPGGLGNCKKGMEWRFHGKMVCFVEEPSTCLDLVSVGRMPVSADACNKGNLGYYCFYFSSVHMELMLLPIIK